MLMKKSILFLSIICASGLTMVSIYNTIIDAQSWGSDIPTSIQTARDYFQHVDPRRFFTVAGPVNLILIVLTVILFWKDSVKIRAYFATSFVLYAAIVILTLVYFVPRDLMLFTSSIPDHIEEIRAASAQLLGCAFVDIAVDIISEIADVHNYLFGCWIQGRLGSVIYYS